MMTSTGNETLPLSNVPVSFRDGALPLVFSRIFSSNSVYVPAAMEKVPKLVAVVVNRLMGVEFEDLYSVSVVPFFASNFTCCGLATAKVH